MSLLPSFDIRYSELEDLAYLQEWFSEPSSCDEYPFGFDEREDALKNWVGFSRFKASLTGIVDNRPCGIATLFLMPYKKVMHQCSFYCMVDPQHRRKGVGLSLIRNILHLAKNRFRLEGVYAEVFQPMPILEKLDFHLFARQENYIKIDGCFRPRLLLEHWFGE